MRGVWRARTLKRMNPDVKELLRFAGFLLLYGAVGGAAGWALSAYTSVLSSIGSAGSGILGIAIGCAAIIAANVSAVR